MTRYVLQRLLGLLPTLFIVTVLVFLFVHLLPGDPARLAAGPDADPGTVALVRADLGLDQPLPQQFLNFLANLLRGDFGHSLRSRRPVSTEIAERFMPTLLLTFTSMGWAVLFGMAIGISARSTATAGPTAWAWRWRSPASRFRPSRWACS